MNPDKDSSEGKTKSLLKIRELLRAIGSLTLDFVSLEYSVILSIARMDKASDWEYIARLLAGDSFSVLLSKYKRIFLYKVKDEDLIEMFKKLYKELNSVREKRNAFLHALWNIDENQRLMRFKLKSDIKTEPLLYDLEEKKLIDITDLDNRVTKADKAIQELDLKTQAYLEKLNEQNKNEKKNKKET